MILSPYKSFICKVLTLVICLVVRSQSVFYPIYASSCPAESSATSRQCQQKDNATEYLFGLKKGGTNILATSDYDLDFFLCEEYTFDCGYVQNQNQAIEISNGIELTMPNAEVDALLPSNAALATKIKSYINVTAPTSKTKLTSTPLTLTSTESEQFFTNYMNSLLTTVKSKYATQKQASASAWSDININIKTAVSQVFKEDRTLLTSSFWDDFKVNNFTEMSNYLKGQFRKTNELYYLRSAYLIDSVSKRCNKYQSVNFLVDESGSIKYPNFLLALDFLVQYITITLDDPKLTSIHFYDSTFEPYLDFGHTKDQLLAGVNSKYYRGLGTNTGSAINQTVDKIMAANFDKGLNKIMIVMTDGYSYDDVLYASNYARSKGITMIAVGIGANYDYDQLLQIAQSPSNIIAVTSYAGLGKLVKFIENFFCKQIIGVKLNEVIEGNMVKVPDSPSYYMVDRSTTGQTYALHVEFQSNPDTLNYTIYRSEFDPFPDEFSEYTINEAYRVNDLHRVYLIYPMETTQLRAKKNFYKTQSFSVAYISIGGKGLKFKLSLIGCTSPGCQAQKAVYVPTGPSIYVPHNVTNYGIKNFVYSTSVPDESTTRACNLNDNATEYLLRMKKGDSNVFSSSDYNANFFLCEQYTFDGGYVQDQNETVSIANGIQLKFTNAQIDTILPTNPTLATKLKSYLNMPALTTKTTFTTTPLTLTATQSQLFFNNYMTQLVSSIKTKYTAEKITGTRTWADLNINVKTAVSEIIKEDKSLLSSGFWDDFKYNNFSEMSDYLKSEFRKTNELTYLRSAYMIQSVTKKCNKYQSINFLIDQSGSIQTSNFQLALDFLTQYLSSTYDDPLLTSVFFYDSALETYLNFGNTKTVLLSGVSTKPYRSGGTYTGDAINKTVTKILAANFDKGMGKILIVMTDGKSFDPVLESANYARANGITTIVIGIGSNLNDTQLLQIAGVYSNIIRVASYADLGKLVDFVQNFFCKQIVDLKMNDYTTGNVLKNPDSPSFYAIEKSINETYELKIKYESDPDSKNLSIWKSQYDPFPDEQVGQVLNQGYRISPLERVYFIYPKDVSQVRLKKTYYRAQTLPRTYVSLAGSNIRFNLSLTKCSSPLCVKQKSLYPSNTTVITPNNTKIVTNQNVYLSVFASSCQNESLTRACKQNGNLTDYLLSLKRGYSDILSTGDYEKNFFLCEEYTFDCGYVEFDNETISIGNGIQLDMNEEGIDQILPVNTSLAEYLKHFLHLNATEAKCGMKVFPLALTAQQSDLFFTNYMNKLTTQIKTKYSAQKLATSKTWQTLNINIRTAVVQIIKENRTQLFGQYWQHLKSNNYRSMSDYLKSKYRSTNQVYYLRSSYLIDSVTRRCNKYQSVNFLIDQSGSIQSGNFALIKNFITQYLTNTYDDVNLTSIYFYDTNFEDYLGFGKTREQLIAGVNSKTFMAGGTYTGNAIRKAVNKILSANLDKGLKKILVVVTDGKSYDEVLTASNYARANSITLIAVGIGAIVNDTQLLQIAENPSNIIRVTSFADLTKLVDFVQNFFCKQIIDLKVNQTVEGNVVRNPQSPAYFRVQKSLTNQTFQLRLKYQSDPDLLNNQIWTSQYDPFPDEFSEYNITEYSRPSAVERIYCILPRSEAELRIKKNLYRTEKFENSYMSVAGSNIRFNVSLVSCNAGNCCLPKTAAFKNLKEVEQSQIEENSHNSEKSTGIYFLIAGSILGIFVISLIAIFIMRKNTRKANQREDDQIIPQFTEQDITETKDSQPMKLQKTTISEEKVESQY